MLQVLLADPPSGNELPFFFLKMLKFAHKTDDNTGEGSSKSKSRNFKPHDAENNSNKATSPTFQRTDAASHNELKVV